jgi:hypothetical protein
VPKNKLQSKITLQNGIFFLRRVNFKNTIAKKMYYENEGKIKIIPCTDFLKTILSIDSKSNKFAE